MDDTRLIGLGCVSRRGILLGATATLLSHGVCAVPDLSRATPLRTDGRLQREIQIHQVSDLGLEIWIENQPPWEFERVDVKGRPQWAATSRDDYHPPSALVFASWPEVPSVENFFDTTAERAIRRASQNFGLNGQESRQVTITQVRYGGVQLTDPDRIKLLCSPLAAQL